HVDWRRRAVRIDRQRDRQWHRAEAGRRFLARSVEDRDPVFAEQQEFADAGRLGDRPEPTGPRGLNPLLEGAAGSRWRMSRKEAAAEATLCKGRVGRNCSAELWAIDAT